MYAKYLRSQSQAGTWQMELKDRGIEDPGPAILLLHLVKLMCWKLLVPSGEVT